MLDLRARLGLDFEVTGLDNIVHELFRSFAITLILKDGEHLKVL